MDSKPVRERTYSEKYAPGKSEYDLLMNKNVDWSVGAVWKVLYIFLIFFSWWFFRSTNLLTGLFPMEDMWTVINVVHCVVSI
jgi:hypothetical protein